MQLLHNRVVLKNEVLKFYVLTPPSFVLTHEKTFVEFLKNFCCMFRGSSKKSKNTEYAAADALRTTIFTCFVMAVS